jgi:hypothetical protein
VAEEGDETSCVKRRTRESEDSQYLLLKERISFHLYIEDMQYIFVFTHEYCTG